MSNKKIRMGYFNNNIFFVWKFVSSQLKPIDVFSPELDREGLYGYIFVYSESSPRWGSRGSTRDPRLTNSLTCQRSQANYWERPTRGNYNGQNLSNRNYSWKAGLFLPTSKGLARAGDKREGVGVEKTPLSAHNKPPPPPFASSLALELTQEVRVGRGEEGTSGPRGWGSQRGTWWSKGVPSGAEGGRVSPREILTESRREFLLRPCRWATQASSSEA